MGTWSYYASQLATSQKDQVRLLIGDVLSSDQQMQDEEINFAISQRTNIYGAAAECTRMLAAKFSRSVDQSAGQTKVMFSQMAKAYTLKSLEFEAKAIAVGGAMPYAGGIAISDKQLQELDTNRVTPQFQLGMEDDFEPVPPTNLDSNQ